MDKVKTIKELLDMYTALDPVKDWDVYYALRLKLVKLVEEL
jgi:hypothetical protein